MFFSSLHHYIIWSDKWYPLVHITVEIHLFGYLVVLSLSPSATSSSSPWLNDESLRVSRVFPWLKTMQCYLEACLWYSDFQQEHLKPRAKCFLLYCPNTVVWVMSWKFSPVTKEFSTLYPVMNIMLSLSLGRIYPWNMCLNTFSFPFFCLIW